MAIMRMKEIRELDDGSLEKRLADMRRELAAERGAIEAGGRASNSGRMRELRRTIARILTVMGERGRQGKPATPAHAPKVEEKQKVEKLTNVAREK